MMIFNRWGEKLFHTTRLGEDWDGKAPDGSIAENGVYVFKILLRDLIGRSHEFPGHVLC